MSDTSAFLLPDWPTAVLAVALALLAAGAVTGRRMLMNIRRLNDALNYMTQGLCMFDARSRIVVCNRQYLRMYGLSGDVVKPGCTLRALLDHRKATGLLSLDPAKYCEDILASIAAGKTSMWTVKAGDGRLIHAVNEPMPGGGWVSTHEDVTEQRELQQQHDDMTRQQERRAAVDRVIASFRAETEALLQTFGDSAAAMKSTAVALSSASSHTSQCAEGAVTASSDAARGVNTAAGAADELSGSIAEIARQITQTNDIVHVAVEEAESTSGEMATLAELGTADRRHRQADPDHCRPDQSAGAQRDHRGSTRRRRRARLRGRRVRSQIAVAADRESHRGDRGTDPRGAGIDRERGGIDPAHHPAHAGNPALRDRRRGFDRAAERRDLQHFVERRERGRGNPGDGRRAQRRCRRSDPDQRIGRSDA